MNTLIVYPPENGTHPYEWVDEDDDMDLVFDPPGSYLSGAGEDGYPPMTNEQVEEAYEKWANDLPFDFERTR